MGGYGALTRTQPCVFAATFNQRGTNAPAVETKSRVQLHETAPEPSTGRRTSWMFRLFEYLIRSVAHDLRLWRSHFERLLSHRRLGHPRLAALPDEELPEGWNVLCDPATGHCYYVSPTGEATWTPPKQPSALESSLWVCDDEECTALPMPSEPAGVSSSAMPAGRWNARTTAAVHKRTSELMRKAEAAIDASRIGRRWESYCAFPQQVVSVTPREYVEKQRQVVWKGHCVFPEHVVVGCGEHNETIEGLEEAESEEQQDQEEERSVIIEA